MGNSKTISKQYGWQKSLYVQKEQSYWIRCVTHLSFLAAHMTMMSNSFCRSVSPTSRPLLDGFMVPRGCILMIFVMPWLFLFSHWKVDIVKCNILTTLGWIYSSHKLWYRYSLCTQDFSRARGSNLSHPYKMDLIVFCQYVKCVCVCAPGSDL